MAGLFSLTGRGGPLKKVEKEENNNNSRTRSSLFLLRNEEIYNKGLEIWPQSYQNMNINYYGNSSSELCVSESDDECGRFGLSSSSVIMRRGGTGSGGMNCQDCGNKAKKDCAHLRCRSCCKSRGFQCQTHVNSTWVPAAKRRERHQQLTALQQQQQQLRGEYPKRHKDNQGSASLSCVPQPITTTGLEVGHFPAEVSSSAVFKCMRVSAIDAQDEQCAYQTAVNIGGHVFKGILYDQGPESHFTSALAEGSSTGGGEAQQLDFIAAATTARTSSSLFDPSLYPPQLNAFMAAGGTQFFPPPRS